MSGPKTASYSVAYNRRVIELAREQAWKQITEWEGRLKAITANAGAAKAKYGSRFTVDCTSPAKVGREAELADLEKHLATLRATCNRLERDIGTAVASAEAQSMLAGLVQSLPPLAGPRRRPTSRTQGLPSQIRPPPPQNPERVRTLRAETASRIMGRITGGLPAGDREEVQALAQNMINAENDASAEMYERQLRLCIQTIDENRIAQDAEAEEAAGLLMHLRGLQTPEVLAVVKELEEVERRQQRLSQDTRQRAHAVQVTGKATADQAYVGETAVAALESLGYEVQSGFSTVFIEGGVARFTRPEWGDYSMQLRADPTNNQVNFNMVRIGGEHDGSTADQAIRDREMEETWCSAFDRVMDALKKNGISGHVVRRVPPGALPVQVVQQEASQRRRSRRKGMAGPKAIG